MGRPRSEEVTKLAKWLDKHGIDRETFAKQLDVARSTLDRLCRGVRRPSLELALKIEKETKGAVPVSSWVAVPPHTSDKPPKKTPRRGKKG